MKANHRLRRLLQYGVGRSPFRTLLIGIVGLSLCACSGPEPKGQGSEPRSVNAEAPRETQEAVADAGGGVASKAGSESAPMDLRTQERLALSSHYTKTGQTHFEAYRYREAKDDLDLAVQANPDNIKARTLRQKVGLILGETVPTIGHTSDRLADERKVRLQQEVIELRRLYNSGVELQKAKQYDSAIRAYERVLERVKWSPYQIDSEGFEGKARANMLKARSLQRVANIERREELERRALQSARGEEKSYQLARTRKVSLLIKRAKDQIRLKQFSQAERTLVEVLRLDRRNTAAIRLKETAINRRHRYRQSKIAERDREALRRDGENAREAGIPYSGN